MNPRQTASNSPSAWEAMCAVAAGSVLLATAGCGGPSIPDHIPPLTPCTVTVTYNGEPVEGASVILAPESGQFSAAGLTDAAGKAVMQTDGMYDGVPAGEYRASVTKREKVELDMGPTPDDPNNLEAYAEYQKKIKSLPVPKYLVPERYSSFAKSGLSVSITEGEPVEATFELTD